MVHGTRREGWSYRQGLSAQNKPPPTSNSKILNSLGRLHSLHPGNLLGLVGQALRDSTGITGPTDRHRCGQDVLSRCSSL